MSFSGLVLTRDGRKEMMKAVDGESLSFTHIIFGDGTTTELYNLKENVSNEIGRFPITEVERQENKIILSLDYTNKSFSKGFYFRELGVIGNGKLCYYDNSGSDAEYIDPDAESVSKEKRLRIEIIVSDEAKIETTAVGGLYVLENPSYETTEELVNLTSGEKMKTALGKIAKAISSLISHLADKENPHEVTKEQVELGNVPNVATNDQTPTYTESSSLTTLTSGEKMSVAFGKIKKAVSSLISHLADKVSHITEAERKSWNSKAAGDHTHTKSEITDFPSSLKNPNGLSINGKTYDGSSTVNVGTIGASYGGTGKTSLIDSSNALINALSTGSDTPVDADYYVSQYVNGGTKTTTYHRRPMSALWNYIKSKLSTVATTGSYSDLKNKPNYAGSSSAGGAATSANKLNTSAGSATKPIYFSDGVPKACTNELNKTVPSNAVFTDTWRGIQNNLTSTSTSDSLSAYQGKLLNDKINGLMGRCFSEVVTSSNASRKIYANTAIINIEYGNKNSFGFVYERNSTINIIWGWNNLNLGSSSSSSGITITGIPGWSRLCVMDITGSGVSVSLT